MTRKVLPYKIRIVIYSISFILAVAGTYFMLPKRGSVERYFEIGRPWNYELLTASEDFVIYKSEATIKAEQDSALKSLEPYMVIDRRVGEREIKTLRGNSMMVMAETSSKFMHERLEEVYASGVISLQDENRLREMEVEKVVLLDENNIGHKVSVEEMYTPKTAYDYIMTKASMYDWIEEREVKALRIETYIEPNVTIDEEKTEQARKEIISSVMLTSGVVQKGEKIIDRGEVVTPTTYQILESWQKLMTSNTVEGKYNAWKVVGSICLIIILYALLYLYFVLFRYRVLYSVIATEFMLLMVLSMLAMLWLMSGYFGISEYAVPMAMLPLVIRVFFDSRTAYFVHIITVLLAAQMVSDPMVFVLLQLVTGMVAVTSLKNMNARSQLLKSILFIFISYVVTFISAELSFGVQITSIDWNKMWYFTINAIALLFVYGLIFIIEKVFGFLSEVTLVELSNVNNSLLMEFSEKCPGTFQHVIQVSNLCVEVAKKIHANALLARTGALYHDLGKMVNPMYYTENQTGVNPLNDLSYEEAAQIIISHVSSGVKIANKHRLPYQIIEFIKMHHGTSKAKYFYNSFKNEFPDKEIDESKFTYPGPLPTTKETAILMMCDSVEAASRSLKSYSDESIDTLVDGVVNGQIADGQFKNSPLSFRDVEIAKDVLKAKLKSIYHTRIEYPELKEQGKEESKRGAFSNLTFKLNGGRKSSIFPKK